MRITYATPVSDKMNHLRLNPIALGHQGDLPQSLIGLNCYLSWKSRRYGAKQAVSGVDKPDDILAWIRESEGSTPRGFIYTFHDLSPEIALVCPKQASTKMVPIPKLIKCLRIDLSHPQHPG